MGPAVKFGALAGAFFGVLLGAAFILAIRILDDGPDRGVPAVIVSGVALAVIVTAAGAAFGALVVAIMRAIGRRDD